MKSPFITEKQLGRVDERKISAGNKRSIENKYFK